MKKRYSLLLAVFLLTGCTAITFDGSRTGNDHQFILTYDILNGTDSQVLSLEEGDQVAVDIVNDKGELQVEVKKEGNEPIYTGNPSSPISFVLTISEAGEYTCTVTGKKAKGSVSFIKQEKEEIEPVGDTESLMGYLYLEGDTLYVDPVEIITTEQVERMEALGLVASNDLPNGYYVHNETQESLPYELTPDTLYNFTDMALMFTQDEASRVYETHQVEAFIQASSYQDKPLKEQKIPYKIEVGGDQVIKITEEFIFTQ